VPIPGIGVVAGGLGPQPSTPPIGPLWKYKTNVELGLKRTLLIVEDDFRSNGSIPYSAGDGV
jgi:hypothetical protein